MVNYPKDTTNLNVRVNTTIKKKSDELFKDLGLNMSTAINIFLTKCVKTSGIPFMIEEPKPTDAFNDALKELDYMEAHPEEYKVYHNVDKMFEDILNEK